MLSDGFSLKVRDNGTIDKDHLENCENNSYGECTSKAPNSTEYRFSCGYTTNDSSGACHLGNGKPIKNSLVKADSWYKTTGNESLHTNTTTNSIWDTLTDACSTGS